MPQTEINFVAKIQTSSTHVKLERGKNDKWNNMGTQISPKVWEIYFLLDRDYDLIETMYQHNDFSLNKQNQSNLF